jgi:putative membrane protein
MVLNSLAGLPAFLVYFCLAGVLTAAYITIYLWITPHDEFALLRANNPAAAISLGFSMIGFALPLTSSIGHSDGVADMVIWGVIALIVQVGVYYAAHIPCSDLSQRIAKGEMAPAMWLGAASVTAGMLNAASMST